MTLYQCEVCKELIPEADGITTVSGSWVCDADTCRTLDDENQAQQKDPSALQCQTDRLRKSFTVSIPQSTQTENLAIEMESAWGSKLGLDNFIGNIRSFKLYLKAQRIFLITGIIV